jgi:DNA-binding NtrC family response regulator
VDSEAKWKVSVLAIDPIERRDEAGVDDDAEAPLDFKFAKRTAIDDFEKEFLARLLTRAGGNLTKAAALASIERHYLRALLKKHGLHG